MTIASPHVPGSPHYRLMLRNGAVRRGARAIPARPDRVPGRLQSAVGGDRPSQAAPRNGAGRAYMTDFPTVYVERPFSKFVGKPIAGAASPHLLCLLRSALPPVRRRLRAQREWRRGQASQPRHRSQSTSFRSASRSASSGRIAATSAFARELGLTDGQPLLIYVGRLDGEKKPDVVVDAFRKLPAALGAKLVADRRGAAARAKSRRSATSASSCRAMCKTAPSSRAGWRAPTSMSRAWPTRRSAFRSSKRRHRACRWSASRRGR